MHKKLKLISVLISIILFLSIASPAVAVQAADRFQVDRTKVITEFFGFYTTSEFEKASPETIVFMYDSQPIRKVQIDIETGKVYALKEEGNNRIGLNNFKTEGPVPNYRYVYSPYTTAFVETYLTAPRFSQTTRKFFLTARRGNEFAQGLVNNSSSSVLAAFAGALVGFFVPGPAPSLIVSLFSVLDIVRKISAANDIWSHTNNGYKVEIRHISSTYGGGCAVFRWSGNRILTHYTLTYPSNEKLVALKFH